MSKENHTNSLDDALMDCLDAIVHGEATMEEKLALYPEYKDELTELLSLAQALNSLSQFAPSQEYVETSLEDLISNLPNRKLTLRSRLESLWQSRLPVVGWRSATLIRSVAILLVVVVLTGGILHTTSAAGPGDLLYGLNLKWEQVQVNLAPDAAAATKIHLDHASKRLQITQKRLNSGNLDSALLALEAYQNEIDVVNKLILNAPPVDQDTLADLIRNARQLHLDVLEDLLGRVPLSAQPAIQHAIEAFRAYDDQPHDSPVLQPVEGEDVPAGTDESGPPEDLPVPPDIVAPPVDPGPPGDLPVPTAIVLPTGEAGLPFDPPLIVTPPDIPTIPAGDGNPSDVPDGPPILPIPSDVPAPPVTLP
jgi:hypothetical protein